MAGGGGPTTSTVNQSSLPAYARPYYEALMDRGAKESTQKYTPYKGDRLAAQSGATTAGLNMANQYAQSGTGMIDQAGNIQNNVANQAGQYAGYQSGNITNAYNGPQQGNYQGSNYASQQLGFGQGGINEVNGQNVTAQQQGFGQNGVNQVGFGQGGMNQIGYGQDGLQQVGSNNFNGAAAQQYMSPYMDAVVNKAQSDALENAAQAQATRNLQAARSGSFGGSRAAVQNQIANNATQSNMTDIMVKGQQSAFENAQQQFNTDQGRAMQAAIQNQNTSLSVGQQNQNTALQSLLANQQAGLTMGGQNQDAALRASLANQSTNLTSQQLNQQAALAMGQSNQNAGLDAAKLNEQSRQYGYGASEQAWQQAGQMGLDAQKANEQFRQSGASLGLQGLDLQQKAGMNLNTLQASKDDAMLNRIKAQLGVGQTQEDYKQQRLDQRYNDFVNQRDSERQNLQFLSSLLQGVPVSANQDVTTSSSQNNLQGVLGATGGLQSLYALGGK